MQLRESSILLQSTGEVGWGALTHRQAGVSGAITRVQRGSVKFAQTLIFKSRPQTQRLRRLPGWQAQPQKRLRPPELWASVEGGLAAPESPRSSPNTTRPAALRCVSESSPPIVRQSGLESTGLN